MINDIIVKLSEPGNARMKHGALMNYLIDIRGHPSSPTLRKQVKYFQINHRKHLAGMALGVSSFGGVVTTIEGQLKLDVVLASPSAGTSTRAASSATL